MPLQIIRADITKLQVDAIVNAANETLLGGGGVDGQIHRAAGPELLEACRALGGCPTGSAKLTSAYRLPCRYVIHAVGPRWMGGSCGERVLLASCYTTALELATARGCESIAFPLISSGIYGYPKEEALQVATEAIGGWLAKSEDEPEVYLAIYDRESFQIGQRRFSEITQYIDDHYVDMHPEAFRRSASLLGNKMKAAPQAVNALPMAMEKEACAPALSLEEALRCMDESFSQMLLRIIDERGMTDAQCYKKANIDRKLFSKIRSDPNYRASKPTVLAFAIALELPLDQTQEMLRKAGFALSYSNKFDVIIEYFIRQGNYNIHEINEALFAFDQSLLGV